MLSPNISIKNYRKWARKFNSTIRINHQSKVDSEKSFLKQSKGLRLLRANKILPIAIG